MPRYLRHNETGKVLVAENSSKPKMSGKGRTWDNFFGEIDGEDVRFFLETSYGDTAYFEYDEQWFKIPLRGKTVLGKKDKHNLSIHDPWNRKMVFDEIKRSEFLEDKADNVKDPYE